jgi:DNA-binding CsgD family transcriptional regulator
VISAAHGNPLALLEVSGLLSPDERLGTEPFPDPVPVGDAIGNAFRRRIAVLDPEAQAALLVAALDLSGEAGVVLAAVAELGLERASLERAEQARLVELAPRFRFLHPLIRAVTVHNAEAGAVRVAHRALAAALPESASAHRRTRHLALAATGPDESLARALEASAADARARSGFAAAASSSERAARLTPDPALRAQRLINAASDCQLAGRFTLGNALADEALTLADDPAVRSEAQQLRARAELLDGRPMDAHSRLVAEAERLAPTHPDQAGGLLADAALACMAAGVPRPALEAARRAHELSAPNGPTGPLAAIAYAEALILVGEAAGADVLLGDAARSVAGAAPMSSSQIAMSRAGFLMVMGAYGEARASAEQLVGVARAASAPSMLPYGLATLAEIDFRTGNWTAAAARGAEAAQMAEETSQTTHMAYALIGVAKIAAGRGDRATCLTVTARLLDLATQRGIGMLLLYVPAVRAFLALGEGALEEAIASGEEIARESRERGLREPGVIWWAPDLIEAYMRSGRREDAADVLARFHQEAEMTGRLWARAAAARCRGLLAPDDGFENAFAEALELHSETPFEQARTQLCLGERRRRSGRRIDARGTLRSALATFDRLEAHPWANRTRAELRASGESARRRVATAPEQLTSHEMRVALMVAQGATNREAAAQLFLSAKTIDFHLGNIYRKLGIRSRTELARQLPVAETAGLE